MQKMRSIGYTFFEICDIFHSMGTRIELEVGKNHWVQVDYEIRPGIRFSTFAPTDTEGVKDIISLGPSKDDLQTEIYKLPIIGSTDEADLVSHALHASELKPVVTLTAESKPYVVDIFVEGIPDSMRARVSHVSHEKPRKAGAFVFVNPVSQEDIEEFRARRNKKTTTS